MSMQMGRATVDLGSDALSQAFYNEVYGSNGSALLQNLLESFSGTITTTTQSSGSTDGNTIALSSSWLPGSGDKKQELPWAQFAVVVAHELGHDVLPYGNVSDAGSNYAKDAVNPAGAVQIGERNETEMMTGFSITLFLRANTISWWKSSMHMCRSATDKSICRTGRQCRLPGVSCHYPSLSYIKQTAISPLVLRDSPMRCLVSYILWLRRAISAILMRRAAAGLCG
jgi:hypothetical protein